MFCVNPSIQRVCMHRKQRRSFKSNQERGEELDYLLLKSLLNSQFNSQFLKMVHNSLGFGLISLKKE